MDTNSDAREVAERVLPRLCELRASLSPSSADVAAIASEVRVPSGSEFSGQAGSHAAIDTVDGSSTST